MGGTKAERAAELDTCPGMTVSCLILLADAFLLNSPEHSAAFELEATDTLNRLKVDRPAVYEASALMWPLEKAFAHFDFNHERFGKLAKERSDHPLSVDIVVARCKTSLMWAWQFRFPELSRLFIYGKCEQSDFEVDSQLEGFELAPEKIFKVGEGVIWIASSSTSQHHHTSSPPPSAS